MYTPASARARFGDPSTPLEQYADLLTARRAGTAATPYTDIHHESPLEFTTPAPTAP